MKDDELREAALWYHRNPAPGKLSIAPTTRLETQRDLALAYSPGVAHACEAIVADKAEAFSVSARGNLVAVISNGSAVLGLGNIGALASKPVMEGKVVLLKRFADIDAFDIEIDEQDPGKLAEIIAPLEPTFGGVILEDIKAPDCFILERELRKRMNVPVFHDDQHGTAIVSAAAIVSGLRIAGKQIEDMKMVVSGAGSAALACSDLIIELGLPKENIFVCDSRGVIYEGRTDGMNEYKERYTRATDARTLDDIIAGADIFLGLSGPGALSPEMAAKMAPKPLILALANPTPEIFPELAKKIRPDAIVATGRSDYPNQVNNVLCFPFLFRGALDCGATEINEAMKLACVEALVDLAMQNSTADVSKAYANESIKYGPDYIIPKPFDTRLITTLPLAVVKAAMATGVATRAIDDLASYERELNRYVTRSAMFMQPVIERARNARKRLIFSDGANDDVLHAVQLLVDEKIALPILVGSVETVAARIESLGLRLEPGKDFELLDPCAEFATDEFGAYLQFAREHGVNVSAEPSWASLDVTTYACLVSARGDADGVICGKEGRAHLNLKKLLQCIGPSIPGQRVSSLTTVLLPTGPLFLTDCYVGVNPGSAEIVAATVGSIETIQRFNIEPKVALLSHSNFGSSDDASATKMRTAKDELRAIYPELQIDGEMHALSSLNPVKRHAIAADSTLEGAANLLVFPNLDAANIALGLLRETANGLVVGPFLSGLARPAHVVTPDASARGIFNIAALAAADISRSED